MYFHVPLKRVAKAYKVIWPLFNMNVWHVTVVLFHCCREQQEHPSTVPMLIELTLLFSYEFCTVVTLAVIPHSDWAHYISNAIK